MPAVIPLCCFCQVLLCSRGINDQLGLNSLIGTVKNCRSVTKEQMLLNNYKPKIEVDSQTYEVRADGQLLVCEPATEVPMAQRYFLF